MRVLQQLNSLYLKQRFFPNFVSLFINPFYLNRVLLLNAIKKYSKDLNGIDNEYKDMPECLKVEKVTVIKNLLKLLTYLKSLKK